MFPYEIRSFTNALDDLRSDTRYPDLRFFTDRKAFKVLDVLSTLRPDLHWCVYRNGALVQR